MRSTRPPNINIVYKTTHRQCADIYTTGFHEPSRWYAVCLLVNVVDRHKLAYLLTCFTVQNFKDLKPEKIRTPHDKYESTAAPSVQRRGGITIITTPTDKTGDTCDDLNLRFDDLPLHEEGGGFVTGVSSQGGAPAAPSKRTSSHGGRPVGLKTRHGDKLFELDPNSSITILKFLEEYDWPHDDVTDIGLTLEGDFPRLGVLTIRHLKLAMNLNYYVQRHLKDYRWSTIAIDRREHVYQDDTGPTH